MFQSGIVPLLVLLCLLLLFVPALVALTPALAVVFALAFTPVLALAFGLAPVLAVAIALVLAFALPPAVAPDPSYCELGFQGQG